MAAGFILPLEESWETFWTPDCCHGIWWPFFAGKKKSMTLATFKANICNVLHTNHLSERQTNKLVTFFPQKLNSMYGSTRPFFPFSSSFCHERKELSVRKLSRSKYTPFLEAVGDFSFFVGHGYLKWSIEERTNCFKDPTKEHRNVGSTHQVAFILATFVNGTTGSGLLVLAIDVGRKYTIRIRVSKWDRYFKYVKRK